VFRVWQVKFQYLLQNTIQYRCQVFRLWGTKCIFRGARFLFHYMFKANFSGHKIWG